MGIRHCVIEYLSYFSFSFSPWCKCQSVSVVKLVGGEWCVCVFVPTRMTDVWCGAPMNNRVQSTAEINLNSIKCGEREPQNSIYLLCSPEHKKRYNFGVSPHKRRSS